LRLTLAFHDCPPAEHAAWIRHVVATSRLIDLKLHFTLSVSAPRDLMTSGAPGPRKCWHSSTLCAQPPMKVLEAATFCLDESRCSVSRSHLSSSASPFIALKSRNALREAAPQTPLPLAAR